jgi:hypothetical protein
MKTLPKGGEQKAFVVRELLVIVLCLVLLVLFSFIPHYRAVKRESKNAQCKENLKQIGYAFLLWVHDNEGLGLPVWVSKNNGGSMEYENTSEVFRHFQIIAKELKEPKYLVCPADSQRITASNLLMLQNTNVSYFVNFENEPKNSSPYCDLLTMIMAGDRNITGGTISNHSMLINSNSPIQWTSDLHNKMGNVVRISGAVETWGTNGWPSYIAYRHFFNVAIP